MCFEASIRCRLDPPPPVFPLRAFRLPLSASPLLAVRLCVCYVISVSFVALVGYPSGGRVEGEAAGLPGPGPGGREAKLPLPSDRAVQGMY